MPTRPAHRIIPTSKLMADNAGDLELTFHRRAVASATAALTAISAPSSRLLPVSALPNSSLPQTDTENASTPSWASLKRHPQATESSSSLNSVIIVSPTTPNNAPESGPKPKKMKTSAALASSDQELSSTLLNVSIIDIDDIDDLHGERLNKSYPTADIKEFFSLAPQLPGQPKNCMKCNLCA